MRVKISIGIITIFCLTAILSFVSIAGESAELWNDVSQWSTNAADGCWVTVKPFDGRQAQALEINYMLKENSGWVSLAKVVAGRITENDPIEFYIKAGGAGDIEMKFIDVDGSIFGKKVPLKRYTEWTKVVIYSYNADHWWGGDDKLDQIVTFEIAISGRGSGSVMIDEIGPGTPGDEASFGMGGAVLDPDRELPGNGFRPRRDAELIAEDPLVLEYLKAMQDTSSGDKALVSSMEDNIAQTFNNSIVAIAFILKGERERAERILDFYANATRVNNDDPTLQNFFYKGSPRGFYQSVLLNDTGPVKAYHAPAGTDRWIGDMAWLLIAYKYYQKEYKSDRYDTIIKLIRDLLTFYYKDDKPGGYIQHGWRNNDEKLHEGYGHPEANIDCYAAMRLCKEDEYAAKIKGWIDANVKGPALALDNYSWRVLAMGEEYKDLLNIPEYDLRYRKTLDILDEKVVGFFHGPDIEVNNIWVDGNGHMACAYMAYGDSGRGYFYANQMDKLLFDRNISSRRTRALPYTVNKTGGYEWVDSSKGFVSCAAWYIFAKNRFNPMTLEKK